MHAKTLRPRLVTPDAPEIFVSQTALAEEFNLLPASFLERLGSPWGRQSLEGGGGGGGGGGGAPSGPSRETVPGGVGGGPPSGLSREPLGEREPEEEEEEEEEEEV